MDPYFIQMSNFILQSASDFSSKLREMGYNRYTIMGVMAISVYE